MRSWKKPFCIISRFLHNNLLILFYKVGCYWKAISNDGNKWILLDVNPNTRFLDLQKIPESEWFGYKSIDFICYWKDFMINHCKLMLKKIYFLNYISNQMLRVWYTSVKWIIIKIRPCHVRIKRLTEYCSISFHRLLNKLLSNKIAAI